MSEMDVDTTQDGAAEVPEACERCTQLGVEQYCERDGFLELTLTTTHSPTRETAIAQYRSRHGSEPSDEELTDEMLRMYYHYPVLVHTTITACSNSARSCQWCDDDYILPDDGHDRQCNGSTPAWMGTRQYSWQHILCASCADYAYTCDNCGEPEHSDHITTVNHDYVYCEACAGYTSWCENCDMSFRTGRHDCPHEEEEDPGDVRVRNYSYKPTPDLTWVVERDGDLLSSGRIDATAFLGLELELELNGASLRDALDECATAFGSKAYYKDDGSLENGFEIVTHPMTLAAHKTLVDWSFLTKLSAAGCRSWNTRTCGTHIHISRSAFRTNRHLAMFQFLILNNRSEMTKIAGRDSERWAAFDGVKNAVIPNLKGRVWRGRYEAINVLNEHTLEIRMFRGSLNPTRILAYLELVDAAFQYTRTMSSNDYINGAAEFVRFARWCAGKEDYMNLNALIADKFSLES